MGSGCGGESTCLVRHWRLHQTLFEQIAWEWLSGDDLHHGVGHATDIAMPQQEAKDLGSPAADTMGSLQRAMRCICRLSSLNVRCIIPLWLDIVNHSPQDHRAMPCEPYSEHLTYAP